MKTNLWRSEIKALLEMIYILSRYFLAKDVIYFYFCNALTFFIDKVRFKLQWRCQSFWSVYLNSFCSAGQHLMEVTYFLNTLCLYSCSGFFSFFFLLLSNIRTESATSIKKNKIIIIKKKYFAPKTYKRSKKAFSNRKED